MSSASLRRTVGLWAICVVLLSVVAPRAVAAEPPARVYVILWFDTEDYLLPASDDAALRVADFLTREHVRATFKVVGEKARTLQRRGRTDVIDALKKHEIGYHSNYHSVQPTPAMYLSDLGWDDGVAEFDRREGPGRRDVEVLKGEHMAQSRKPIFCALSYVSDRSIVPERDEHFLERWKHFLLEFAYLMHFQSPYC